MRHSNIARMIELFQHRSISLEWPESKSEVAAKYAAELTAIAPFVYALLSSRYCGAQIVVETREVDLELKKFRTNIVQWFYSPPPMVMLGVDSGAAVHSQFCYLHNAKEICICGKYFGKIGDLARYTNRNYYDTCFTIANHFGILHGVSEFIAEENRARKKSTYKIRGKP